MIAALSTCEKVTLGFIPSTTSASLWFSEWRKDSKQFFDQQLQLENDKTCERNRALPSPQKTVLSDGFVSSPFKATQEMLCLFPRDQAD